MFSPFFLRRADALAAIFTVILLAGAGVPVASRCQDLAADRAETIQRGKTLAIGMLMYAQDYDEVFPQAATMANGKQASWNVPVQPYLRNATPLKSPLLPMAKNTTTWMYNDFVAGQGLFRVSEPARTILLVDGDDVAVNVGHAYDPKLPAATATLREVTIMVAVKGKKSVARRVWAVVRGAGARAKAGPTRFENGGIHVFTDGHVKWISVTDAEFAPRSLAAGKHAGGTSKKAATVYTR